MLLRAVTIIASAIVNASHRGGAGLERHFKERGTGIDCIDTNDPSIEASFRAHDRLPECPWIHLYAGFNAGSQMVIGHRKGTSLQRLGCANLGEAGAYACATCQQHDEE
jgi:hypothetical protein